MKGLTGKSHWVAITGVTFYVVLRSVSAWSAGDEGLNTGTPITDGQISDPRVGSQLPPTFFDPAVAQRMASTFQSCANVAPALNQIGDAILGKPVSTAPGGDCGDMDPPSDGASCRDFTVGNRFDPKRVEELGKRIDVAITAVGCRKSKLDGAQSQISCMMNQASALQAQITALNKSFADNIQRAQRDVGIINSVVKEREAQLEETNKRLQGDPESGRKGLLQLKQDTEKLVNEQMPQQIQQAREKYKDIENNRKGLEEQIVNRKMQLTNDCFNQRSAPNFRCTPNGAPVSIRDYVLCRYEQNQQLGEKGQIERNQILADQAASRKRALESILNGIVGDSAGTLQVDPQKDPGAAQQAMSRPVSITNIQELEAQYGEQLRGFNGKGLDIYGFVTGQMRSCYSRADKVIARERKLASSAIGVADFTLKKQEREAGEFANTLIEGYSQQWRENMAGLTGQNLPLNTQACSSGNPDIRVECLEDIRKNMIGLLNGSTPQSSMNMVIIGTRAGSGTAPPDPSSVINVSCQGLAGCVTALQNVSTNLTREKKRVEDFKKDYVLKAKQSVSQFTQQMVPFLNPQSASLEAMLQKLNSDLALVGASPINIKSIASEELQYDEDGLPMPPKNVLGFVGSQLNPPMKDMSDGGLNEGLQSIAEKTKELERRRDRLQDRKSRITELASNCKLESIGKLAQELKTQLNSVTECRSLAWCEDRTKGTLESLLGSLREVNLDLGEGQQLDFGTDIDMALDSGQANCNKTRELTQNLRGYLDTSGKRVDGLEDQFRRAQTAQSECFVRNGGLKEKCSVETSEYKEAKDALDSAKKEVDSIPNDFAKCKAISSRLGTAYDQFRRDVDRTEGSSGSARD